MSLFKKLSLILNKKPKAEIPKHEVKVPKEVPEIKDPKKVLAIQEELIQAKAQARELILEAKDESLRIKERAQSDANTIKEQVERRLGAVEERERILHQRNTDIETRIQQIEEIKKEQLQKLERVASLTKEQAKTLILSAWEDKLKDEIAKKIKETEEKVKEEALKTSQEILVDAMRHGATNYVAEYTVSAVKINDEEMKGRIIGKEGRNIRAFEQATGVDVDLDEEGVIRLSSFDSIRREIARITLEKLMADGRIQPVRIEELVVQVKKDIERIMYLEGEKLCHSVGVYKLPNDLIALLGRFKYRFSYGQNMIAHTLEETRIGIALATEIKADVNVVRLGCLLHDIGKVITDEEGSHVELGVSILKKYGIPQSVIDCVAQHHEDTPFTSNESVLVYISDAISGARPGARYEDHEEYIKRLKDLEEIAKKHKGVKEVYAYQAGRELRIIVEPKELDDSACVILSQKIREEIEEKLTYAGNINVTVIRENRFTEIAR